MASLTRKKGFDPLKGLLYGAVILFAVTLFGTLTYWVLGNYVYADRIQASGQAPWTFMRCVYMMVITVTTIGYGDILETSQYPIAAGFTYIMAVFGMGVPVFMITMVNMLIIEGFFSNIQRKRRMRRRIDALANHTIVCGLGDTGIHTVRELAATFRPFVVIDSQLERLEKCEREIPELLYIQGDATREETLREAGLLRAGGLVACLANDRDNLFLTFIARQHSNTVSHDLRIVSRAVDDQLIERLKKAGADIVVCPNQRGGIRMVSEMESPTATSFMDRMLTHREKYRFEELTVTEKSDYAGKPLGHARRAELQNLVIVALHAPNPDSDDSPPTPNSEKYEFQYNPSPDELLYPGTVLIVIGKSAEIRTLRGRNFR